MKLLNKKTLFYWILLLLLGFFLYQVIPLMAKEHKQNKIRKEIEIVELRIEKNKQERLNCEANMKLWNQENEENRVILNELKEQYTSMVGFTSAWQPQ